MVFENSDIVGGIWSGDHSLWKSDPKGIVNRLGWLGLPVWMQNEIPKAESFAAEIAAEGFQYVVLLGVGGSALGAMVIGESLGRRSGYPDLIVVDSAIPSKIRSVLNQIDLRKTLFVVSSKSGRTVEPNLLYRYFKACLEKLVDRSELGAHFVAITDRGSPLEDLASKENFREIFLNPSDVGGRYSVLSYFGIVPAALIGQDLTKIISGADRMRNECRVSDDEANPGLVFGNTVGSMALEGKDKLTLVISPKLATFGLWAEQLIAESTGKDGRGIVPITNEPVLEPDAYGNDRLFVYVRLEGDDNDFNDKAIREIEESGHPVIRLNLSDIYDVGSEFFRWEFATAVASALFEVNPFNQPDVEFSKKQTESLLSVYEQTGVLNFETEQANVSELLGCLVDGDYLTLMVFASQTSELDKLFADLRAKIMRRYKIATSLVYGPQFLHSTGQIHKGGVAKGVFFQITTKEDTGDFQIPDLRYTFGMLVDAQAQGDLVTLRERGKKVARFRIGKDQFSDIEKLFSNIESE